MAEPLKLPPGAALVSDAPDAGMPLPPGATLVSAPPQSEQAGFGARASQQIGLTQHPIDQLITELKALKDHPVDTLWQSVKAPIVGLRDLTYNLVRHPVDTVQQVTGGPQFATDVKSGNWRGALGTLAADAAQVALGKVGARTAPATSVEEASTRALQAAEAGSKGMIPSPIQDTLDKPRGTVPAEAATPTELAAYARENNIPINAAQATEHNIPRNMQSVGERASIGGTAVRQQTKAAQAAVSQHAQNLMDGFSPNTPDVATAGETIKGNVQTALDRELAKSRANYAAVDQLAGGNPTAGAPPTVVDLTAVKAEAQRLLSNSSFLRDKVPALDAKRAATVLKGVTQLPDNASFSQVQDLRSALIDEASHPENAISQQAQAWIKQMSGAADSAMAKAAQSNPQLEPAFRAANEHWKALQEDFNNQRSPLSQILKEPDPSKVPQKLTQQGQIGGSPYNAGLLDKYGIDKGPVKWAITGDMAKKDFGLYNGGKTLGGYSDDFLRSVFTPQELSEIYKTGAIARSVRMNTNPSGTAGVNSAVEDVTSVGKGKFAVPGTKALAAKATNSPAFNDWLLENPAPSQTNVRAYGQWLNARQQALRAAAVASAVKAPSESQSQ